MSFPFIAALGWRAVFNEYVSTKTFNVGNLGMTEDGSFWRLAKAGGAMTNAHRGVINANRHLTGVTGDSAETALNSAIAAGDTSMVIDDATNARAADYWKGGYTADPRAAGEGPHYIWKSDAENSDKYTIHVGGDFALANASGNTVHAYPSPYGDIRAANARYPSGNEQFAGAIPFGAITSGKYFWLKVKGPNWFGVTSTWPGAAAEDRLCTFHTDGSIEMADESYNGGKSNQIAGYLMYSGDYGDVMLMMNMW